MSNTAPGVTSPIYQRSRRQIQLQTRNRLLKTGNQTELGTAWSRSGGTYTPQSQITRRSIASLQPQARSIAWWTFRQPAILGLAPLESRTTVTSSSAASHRSPLIREVRTSSSSRRVAISKCRTQGSRPWLDSLLTIATGSTCSSCQTPQDFRLLAPVSTFASALRAKWRTY